MYKCMQESSTCRTHYWYQTKLQGKLEKQFFYEALKIRFTGDGLDSVQPYQIERSERDDFPQTSLAP